jgi:hypothetical protein
VSQVPPPGTGDARAPDDDAACWRHAERLRREHPPWVVIWIAQAREYRAYRRSVTLTAETPDDLAAQITQEQQARS